MNAPRPVKLADVHLHIRTRGPSEVRAPDFSGGVMATESDHKGERHLDGDEVL
jgi:hypothetical protein